MVREHDSQKSSGHATAGARGYKFSVDCPCPPMQITRTDLADGTERRVGPYGHPRWPSEVEDQKRQQNDTPANPRQSDCDPHNQANQNVNSDNKHRDSMECPVDLNT